jgi:hypothetical protein
MEVNNIDPWLKKDALYSRKGRLAIAQAQR